MPIFSALHRKTVCEELDIDDETFVAKIKLASKSVSSKSYRSIDSAILDGSNYRTVTAIKILETIKKIGFEGATEEWLMSDGAPRSQENGTLLGYLSDKLKANHDEQIAVASLYGGPFVLFRKHGTDPQKVVREHLFVSSVPRANPRVWLVNHRGAIYRGTVYRSFGVLYFTFGRPHRKFEFVKRSLLLTIQPSSADLFAASGVMSRIRKSLGVTTTSDVVVARGKECDNAKFERSIDLLFEQDDLGKNLLDIEEIPTEDTPLHDLNGFQRALVGKLRPPIASLSQDEILKVIEDHKNAF